MGRERQGERETDILRKKVTETQRETEEERYRDRETVGDERKRKKREQMRREGNGRRGGEWGDK